MLGGCGLLQKGLELFLGQRDAVGQQLLKKLHALAEAVRPVLAHLLFLLLDKPLFLVFKLANFFLDACDFFGFGLCYVSNALFDVHAISSAAITFNSLSWNVALLSQLKNISVIRVRFPFCVVRTPSGFRGVSGISTAFVI